MPHALIGYAGSTLKAAEIFVDTFPGEPVTVLVDYYGREVTDALTVCRRFPELASGGMLISASTLTADGSSRAWTHRLLMRFWNGTRLWPCAATVTRKNCACLLVPAYRQQLFSIFANNWIRKVSIG